MSSEVDLTLEVFRLSEKKKHLDDFLEEFLCLIRKAFDIENCHAFLLDKESDEVFYHISCGVRAKIHRSVIKDEVTTEAINKLISNRKRVNHSNDSTNKLISDILTDSHGIKIRSVILSLLKCRGKVFGLLVALNKKTKSKFSKKDEKLLQIFSAQAALVVYNSRLIEENITKKRLSQLGQRIIDSAHGLKNILNNMDGGTYIVERGTLTKNIKEVNKGWDILKRNSNRLRELVLDILFFSRSKKPEYKLIDINSICRDVKELIEQSATENNVEVALDLDNSIKQFCLDPKGIYRCVLNLVSNGIYACNEKGGGKVSIQTSIDMEENLHIDVTDNGIGISKENLKYIFDVFFSTKGSKGTGLGLAVTKKVVNEHLGKIEVESEVGRGSKFSIILPRRKSSECSKSEAKKSERYSN
jgi:signal transduction histidine kinase